ncbi:MAG: DUF3048 domain-containing protein, partial [Actinobacteria bacterium]|nr:DUF3048 domain-containing protein [Actinomycetota bacterium]
NNYSPTSKTVGSGKVYVFTNGVMYEGKWTRDDRLKPFALTDSAGAPIKLTPGQTFVEVARAAKTAIVTRPLALVHHTIGEDIDLARANRLGRWAVVVGVLDFEHDDVGNRKLLFV